MKRERCEEPIVDGRRAMIGSVTVGNKHRGDVGIYIGRGSVFGNPFSHLGRSTALVHVPTREEAIRRYDHWLDTSETDQAQAVREGIEALAARVARGEHITLVCYCAPRACHGDSLAGRIMARANEEKLRQKGQEA